MKIRLTALAVSVLLLGTQLPPAVASETVYQVSGEGIDALVRYENFYSYPQNIDGKWYVGYESPCQETDYPEGISSAEAEQLFVQSLEQPTRAINKFLNALNISLQQYQFDALLALTHQVGETWLDKSLLADLLQAGIGKAKATEVVQAFALWAYEEDGKTDIDALNRRIDEARLFLYGNEDLTQAPKFFALLLDTNGGTAKQPLVCYESGKIYGKLPEATRAGYTLTGWQSSANSLYTLSTSKYPSKHMQVKAIWEGVKTFDFTDVQSKDWFYTYVYDLTQTGIIHGRTETRFDPSGLLSYAEASKLITLAVGYPEQAPTQQHWASGYLALVKNKGFLDSLPDNIDAPIDRLHVATLAARALGLPAPSKKSPFFDTDDNAVVALYEAGILQGSYDNQNRLIYAPQNRITRAEISAIIWRIQQLEDKPTIPDTPKPDPTPQPDPTPDTPTPDPTPTPTPTPSGNMAVFQGRDNRLNVRAGAGTSYAVLGVMVTGEAYPLLATVGDWYKIDYKGQAGYLSKQYVTSMTAKEYEDFKTGTSPTPTPTPEPTPDVPVAGDKLAVFMTNNTLLNVRAGAGTSFDVLGKMNTDEAHPVLALLDGWYKIDYKGQTGYVSKDYVTLLSKKEYEDYLKNKPTTPTPTPTPDKPFDPKTQFKYGNKVIDIVPDVPKSPYNAELFYQQDGRTYYNSSKYRYETGIDVSSYQGNIDWNKVKADGIDFAIIRIGGRGWGSAGDFYEDSHYRQNIEGAKQAGLKVGAYIFSQAITEAEAIEEANYVLQRIRGYNLDYPIVFDWEVVNNPDARTNNLDPKILSKAAIAFCETVKKEGYHPMVYFNAPCAYERYDLSMVKDYDFWYAQYYTKPNFYYTYKMWQYSSTGTVNGIAGKVDMNLYFLPKD